MMYLEYKKFGPKAVLKQYFNVNFKEEK